MTVLVHCKNCKHEISSNFCRHCGQAAKVKRLTPKTLFDEIITLYFNSTSGLWFTIKRMLFYPGKSILEYIDGARKKYQSPISYFGCSIFLYFLYKKFVLGSLKYIPDIRLTEKDIGNGLTLDINHLFILLLGMSLIGWVVCGLRWGDPNKRTFTFIESVVVFSYIYGTNFFLDPLIISFEIPFWRDITHFVGEKNIKLTTDIPLTIIIAYIAFDFCKKAKISTLRYIITLIVGFAYYYYTSNFIDATLKHREILQQLHDSLKHKELLQHLVDSLKQSGLLKHANSLKIIKAK